MKLFNKYHNKCVMNTESTGINQGNSIRKYTTPGITMAKKKSWAHIL